MPVSSERAPREIDESLSDLLFSIHDEGPTHRHRLVDRLARQNEVVTVFPGGHGDSSRFGREDGGFRVVDRPLAIDIEYARLLRHGKRFALGPVDDLRLARPQEHVPHPKRGHRFGRPFMPAGTAQREGLRTGSPVVRIGSPHDFNCLLAVCFRRCALLVRYRILVSARLLRW